MAKRYELEVSVSAPVGEDEEIKILGGGLQGTVLIEAKDNFAASKFVLEMARDVEDQGLKNYKFMLWSFGDDGFHEELITVVDYLT